jgi:uncharacterized protein involved in type VI secretion and phage assembly
MSQLASAVFSLTVDGNAVDTSVLATMVSGSVDQSVNLPDAAILTFRDSGGTVLQAGKFSVGAKLKLNLVSEADPGGAPLFEGEVVALEAEIDRTGTYSIVRAYDISHRLMGQRHTQVFKQKKYSDAVKVIAGAANIPLGNVDATSKVHPHLWQENVDDWTFLRRMAEDVGYTLTVAAGKLNFAKHVVASGGPAPATSPESPGSMQLAAGSNLLTLRAVSTSAQQVKEVTVRSWSAKDKKEVVGKADIASAGTANGASAADLSKPFNRTSYLSFSSPHDDQDVAQAAAQSIANRLGSSSGELEGVARGDPKLSAGTAVSIGLLGPPFDGRYVLTHAHHTWDPEQGYVTRFGVSGDQDRSLTGITAGGYDNRPRFHGVAPAIVTNNKDDEDPKCGRVKVKFPWLSDDESDWCRVAAPGLGAGRGLAWLPEVNDEVLVSFEHGDIRRPYIIGALHNGKDAPPFPVSDMVGSDGKVVKRGLVTTKGHKIVVNESPDKSSIELTTSDGNFSLVLDEKNQTIKVTSNGKLEIKAQQDITIEGGTSVKIKAGTDLQLEAGTNLTAKGGSQVSVEGSGPVQVKGSVIQLN